MMKKTTLLSLVTVIAFGIGTMAQNREFQESTKQFDGNSMIQRTPTDTLAPGVASGYTQYTTSTGYVVGVNQYGDLAKAQYFLVVDGYNVEGALFWFGGKNVGGDGDVNFNIWEMDGDAETSNSPTDIGPGTVAVSEAVALSNIDTSGSLADAYVHTFATPFSATYDYAIGFDMNDLTSTDTIGMVSSLDGDDIGLNSSFEQWSDGAWYSMLAAWPLDIFFGIFPIIDADAASIEDMGYINGIKAQMTPNPASSNAVLTYELEESRNVQVIIYDASGRRVAEFDNGMMNNGQHTLSLNVNDWDAGVYYYSVIAGNLANSFTSKFIVTK